MKLTDILAKIAKGETLNDEEKSFVGSYDPQKDIDAAASAARKKAEKEAADAKTALEKLQGEFDTFKSEHDPAKGATELQKLTKRLEKLEADKKAAEDKAVALERNAKVRALAKEAGINPAKGVDSKTIDLLVDNLMKDVDLDDGDAVKAAFDGFKTSNAGLIAAGTIGGAGQKGTPGAGAYTGANPFSKKTFNLTKQIELRMENPEQADALKAAAEAEG